MCVYLKLAKKERKKKRNTQAQTHTIESAE